MIARVRARLSRTVAGTLGALAVRSPRLAFLAADLLAKFWTIFGRRFSRARLLLPNADLASMWRTHVRTQLLDGWMRHDRATALRLVQANDAITALRPPMIIGTFHVGPTYALGAVSERLSGETFALRGPQGTTDQERAAKFYRAVEQLRSGFVIVALDPREAQRIATPFLGGTLQLARGPFAMARIARVPIVPVVARWEGDGIVLVVGDAIEFASEEQTMADAAAGWLEGYLREYPGELSYRVLELERRRPAG